MKASKSLSVFTFVNDKNQAKNLPQWKLSGKKVQSGLLSTRGNELSYATKKSLLSNLNIPKYQRFDSSTQLKDKIQRKIYSSKSKIQRKSNRLISQYVFSNNNRPLSSAKANIPNQYQSTSNEQNMELIRSQFCQNWIKGYRTLAVINIQKLGIRSKINYCLKPKDNQISHQKLILELKFQFEMQFCNKPLYLFHLSADPIGNIWNDVNHAQCVILADISPRIHMEFDLQMLIFEQAAKIEEAMKLCERQMEIKYGPLKEKQIKKLKTQETIFQSTKHNENIKKYVDQLIQNPQRANQNKSKYQLFSQTDKINNKEMSDWLSQQYIEQINNEKQTDKNPLFRVHCHFPQQAASENMLNKVSRKLQMFDQISNQHRLRATPLDVMLETIKRQTNDKEKKKKNFVIQNTKIMNANTNKQFIRKLEKKNTLLSFQNVPLILQKYGITRAQAHNLYSIYKALEKVSAIKLGTQLHQIVYERGIDRQTFDQQMNRLSINPGDEVVRNICHFPDFINWQQFLKIISISLRKTPQEKLSAILQGIGGINNGYLTRLQIEILVGNSIHKIFNGEEPQLKKYFISVVLKELDPENTGKIQISVFKKRVLETDKKNMDIVSFLMLNS